MPSNTTRAERKLQRTLEAVARERLGPRATQAAVREAAARLYEGCSRADAGYETPVQRWQRERHARGTAEDLRRSHR